jgi:membrane protein DedA with SNARE-associated domain
VTAVPDLLRDHGAVVLFAWAFAVQAGMPAPAIPMLVGAGALSGSGHMDLALAIGAAMAATLGADGIWYWLGRAHGARVLGVLVRFSLDPDALIRRAKERFAAHRARYLILAKFLPGVNPLAAGLAGVFRTPPADFLLHAATGAFLWAGAWITLGYLCANVIAGIVSEAARLGRPVVMAVVAGLVVYVGVKFVRRRRALRQLRKARIDERGARSSSPSIPAHRGGGHG